MPIPKNKQGAGSASKELTRALFVPNSLNEESRTVDVVFATPTPVLRYSWGMEEYYNEVLDMNGADLSRSGERGLPVLDNHSRWGSVADTVIGRAENLRREGDQWVATVRFSKRENVQELINDIRDGIITDISFGYSIDQVERSDKKDGEKYRTYNVRKWTPSEISFVTIPADPKAGVRSEQNEYGADLLASDRGEPEQPSNSNTNNTGVLMKREQIIAALKQRGITVDENISDEALTAELERALKPAEPVNPQQSVQDALAAERKRVAEINDAVRAAGLPAEFGEPFINDGKTIDQARAAILDELKKNSPTGGVRGANAGITADEKDKLRSAMGDALELRANPGIAASMKPERVSAAREFRGMSLLRLAEESLSRSGVRTNGMSQREIAQAALGLNDGMRAYHTTSDFPIMLGETFNRTLRGAYELNPQTFAPFTRRVTANDFRAISRVEISGLIGSFDEVKEGGEYTSGTFSEAKETYKLAKYGKKVAITWESVINDDLSVFSRIPSAIAAKAKQKQSDLVYSILLNNPTMGDNVALFHAGTHKNYTSTGTALSEGSLDTAFQLFRNQKSIEGDYLNLSPRILIVGPKNELLAYKLTSTNYTPAKQTDVSSPSFTGLQVVVEPRITDYAWFLAAEPNMVDTIEYAFLDGEQELFTEQRVGFDVDGLEIKARMVFAAAPIGWRGLYKNNGANPNA